MKLAYRSCVVAFVVIAASCSGGGDGSSAPSTTAEATASSVSTTEVAASTTVAETVPPETVPVEVSPVVWTVERSMFDLPTVAGDILLTTVLDGADEVLIGVSADGEQLWERPIASRSTSPFRSTWLLLDGLVYVVEDGPEPQFDAFVVAVSPESGQELARSGAIQYRPGVSNCSQDGVTQLPCAVSDLELVLFDPVTLEVTAQQEFSRDGSDSFLALSFEDAPDEQLNVHRDRIRATRDGADLWSTWLTDLLDNPVPGADGLCCIYTFELPPDLGGPRFGLDTDASVVFGSLSGPETITSPDGRLFQYSLNGVTVGLDRETGARRWLRPGNLTSCGVLLTEPTNRAAFVDSDLPLACVVEGSGTFVQGQSTEITSGAATTLVRFDPADGQPVWEVDLGDVAGLRADRLNQSPARAVDPAEILVETADGALVVNIETGATRSPADAELFLCQERSTLRNMAQSAGGFLTFPCGADFEPVSADEVRSIPEEFLDLGARFGNLVVYATRDGLIAVDPSTFAQG